MPLNPGPKLDKLVAEALGEPIQPYIDDDGYGQPTMVWPRHPPRSTDPGEAIKALEEFCKDNELFFYMRYWYPPNEKWAASVDITTQSCRSMYIGRGLQMSLAHAICFAIVEAAGKGEK